MSGFEISSLVELATYVAVSYFHTYHVRQIIFLPGSTKDLIRTKVLRRRGKLSAEFLSALLHDKVYSVDLTCIQNFNKNHIRALENLPDIRHLTLTELDTEKCVCSRNKETGSCVRCCACKADLTDVLKVTLGSFNSLVRLELSNNPSLVNEEIIIAVAEVCLNLQEIEVANCHKIGDKAIVLQEKVWTNLNQQEMDPLKVRGLVTLKSLHSVNLLGTAISDLALISFGIYSKSRHTLKELVVDRCRLITDLGIEKILDACDNLEIFSFANCDGVTWESASKLSGYFENRKLDCGISAQRNGIKQLSFSIW